MYAVGLGLGLVLSYAFFGDRYPTWLPGSIVLEDLLEFKTSYSDKAICNMECRNISKDGIREMLTRGDVLFSESETRAKPCPSYVIEGETDAGRLLRVVFTRCDSTSEVLSAHAVDENLDCSCD